MRKQGFRVRWRYKAVAACMHDLWFGQELDGDDTLELVHALALAGTRLAAIGRMPAVTRCKVTLVRDSGRLSYRRCGGLVARRNRAGGARPWHLSFGR